MALKLAFMGTPEFSVPTLRALLGAGHDVAVVYAQPPRKSGRGQKVTPSPVHGFAQSQGIEVRTPLNFKSPEDVAAFEALGLDAAIVVAYGLILPQPILDAPRLGCLNLHASLLPRWRGAAPIQRAIMAGDDETGVMVMQMEAGLDTGPVLLAERIDIGDKDTAGTLQDRLSGIGGPLMVEALAALEGEGLTPKVQCEKGATYAKKISKDEAKIDWSKTAVELDAHIRGLTPAPGAWTEVPTEKGPTRVKVITAEPVGGKGMAGELIETPFTIACGDGALKVTRVQKAGKSPVSVEEFARGLALPKGVMLETPNG
jgi:methionyl-tRNA formyltransferase